MFTKSHKTILNLFFAAFALIALSACTAGGGSDAKQPNFVNCASNSSCDPGPVDPSTGYQPATSELPQADGWVEALKAERTPEYQASGGADRIGAAYAYARGTQFTGAGIFVANVGQVVDSTHADLSATGKLIQGYDANGATDSDRTATNAGKCAGATACGDNILGTHIAALIAGESGNGGVQGIAYNAKIKPINIYKDNGRAVINDKTVNAIQAASGMVDAANCPSTPTNIEACQTITVMNNNWDVFIDGGYPAGGVPDFLFPTPFKLLSDGDGTFQKILSPAEIMAWEKAVETTVLVFAHGDYGFNSINGMVRRGDGGADEAWSTIRADIISAGSIFFSTQNTINVGSTYSNLPDVAPDVLGKMLTVIALDSSNLIHKYSNGCGDAKAYCLGAPGVAINSAIPGAGSTAYKVESGTAIAATHVSGAIAVLKGAFPSLTPTQLVSIILNTADYIKENDADTKTDGTNGVYGHGALNLARATDPIGSMMTATPMGTALAADASLDNSGITLPTSFGNSLDGFTVGFIDDYNRAYIGNPARITRENAAFTLGDTIATWESPELQNIALDSNSKMQFTNYDENSDAKDTLIFTHNLPNHTVAFSYNEESKTPDLMLAGDAQELHFQKIRPIASDLMQLNSTHKLGKAWNVKNSITSGEFDTGNRFNEAMANLNYTGENHQLTIGAGTLKEYGQFLGASGTGAYQLSDATSSQVTHLAVTQNLPRNSAIKLKYTGFKTEVDMRYNNFANINDLTADEYQLSLTKKQLLGKNDSLNLELIQPFAVTDGNLQQSTVLGYNEAGDYNNVTQNYSLAPTNRRQQLRMTWQNQMNLKNKTKLFISMQYENHAGNLRDNEDSQILGGISTRF